MRFLLIMLNRFKIIVEINKKTKIYDFLILK